jgi:adenylate kinase family enzyme
MMSKHCDIAFVLFFECPDEVMVERILQRGQSGSRSDDNAETIKARFRVEETETKPIVEMFRSAGKIRSVDANRDVNDVFADVSLLFDAIN